jgi:integrase
MKITKSFVDKVEPPKPKTEQTSTQDFYRDEAIPGFGLRITSGGAKSFIVEKRVNGRVKRMTLGRYGNLTVEQARTEAMKILGKVATGSDPIAEKRERYARSVSLQQVFNDYLKTRKDLKESTIQDYTKIMNTSFDGWLNTPIAEITKDMVEKKHRVLGERSEARANNSMRVLRALINHAMSKYEDAKGNPIMLINPVDRLSQTRAWYKVEPRKNLIRPTQLKPWYEATLQLNNETSRDYLHFLLFTGLRKTEAAQLRWENINFEEKTFTIPDTKNSEPHTLPFSNFIEELLLRRFESRQSFFVFPSESKTGYIQDPRKAILKVCEISGVEFRLHDLRRTFITIAESRDIPAYALKKLLNHKDKADITAGYIISDFSRLREPMRVIEKYILSMMSFEQQ